MTMTKFPYMGEKASQLAHIDMLVAECVFGWRDTSVFVDREMQVAYPIGITTDGIEMAVPPFTGQEHSNYTTAVLQKIFSENEDLQLYLEGGMWFVGRWEDHCAFGDIARHENLSVAICLAALKLKGVKICLI